MIFEGFYAFDPTHPYFDGIISVHDLNCAVSKPNALYGSKVTKQSPVVKSYDESRSFTLHALKIKPLDLPVGFVTINLRGLRSNNSIPPLAWSVDFPAGFHDVLVVRMKEFTKTSWEGLTRLEVWADFHNGEVEMEDWEFCIDDLELEMHPRG